MKNRGNAYEPLSTRRLAHSDSADYYIGGRRVSSFCERGFPWAGRVPRKLPKYSFYIGAHALNGSGDRPRLWVSLLQQLTCVERLDVLTTLPWANAISSVHLLRASRAWCSSCYGTRQSSAQLVASATQVRRAARSSSARHASAQDVHACAVSATCQ